MLQIDEHSAKMIAIDFGLIEKAFEVIKNMIDSGRESDLILAKRLCEQNEEIVKDIREQFQNFALQNEKEKELTKP